MSKKVSGWPLIVPKEVDTSITGDQIMEALASDVEAGDSGKVLTATYGGLEGEETASVVWASPLPVIGEGDAGKVLTVNAGETGAEWAEQESGLTTYVITTVNASVYDDTTSNSDVSVPEFAAMVNDALNNNATIILRVKPDANSDPRWSSILRINATPYELSGTIPRIDQSGNTLNVSWYSMQYDPSGTGASATVKYRKKSITTT